jgi:DNA-binding transcriptional MocR family regulator
LDGVARGVGWALETYANPKTMQARPSVVTLAKAAGVSERTVGRALVRLEDAGYLVVKWSRGGACHLFTLINPEAASELLPERPSESASDNTEHASEFDSESEALNPEPGARNPERGSEEAVEAVEASPLPPPRGGSRANGTNPRAVGRALRIAKARTSLCVDCEVGGGRHAADCPRVVGAMST